jgi:hypothetical protein
VVVALDDAPYDPERQRGLTVRSVAGPARLVATTPIAADGTRPLIVRGRPVGPRETGR